MKKLMLLLVLLAGTQTIFAQKAWKELKADYNEIYLMAEKIGEQTDKVLAEETKSEDELTALENTIALMKTTGAISFRRELDPDIPVEFYKYTLIKQDGTELPLVEKMLVEKVIEKYKGVMVRIKESLKADRKANAADILKILDAL